MTSVVPTASGSNISARRSLFASSILILSNLVPLAGLLWWGWDAFVLLCLYCLETAVIGFWTIPVRPIGFGTMRPAVPSLFFQVVQAYPEGTRLGCFENTE